MNLAKISKKLRIKWNFELTVFKLTVPGLYMYRLLVSDLVGIIQRRMSLIKKFLLTDISHIHPTSSPVQTHSPDYKADIHTRTHLYR